MGRESEQQKVSVDDMNAMADMLRESLKTLESVIEFSRKNDIPQLVVRQIPKGEKAMKDLIAFTALMQQSMIGQIFQPKKQTKKSEAKELSASLESAIETERKTKRE